MACSFPHCGYPDAEMEKLYGQLQDVLDEAARERRLPIIAADWNAEVGSWRADEGYKSLGMHAEGHRNQRGEWMLAWTSLHNLIIANSYFRKRWAKQWTHLQAGRERIIDYVCLDARLKRFLVDGEACESPDLGSDHRAYRAVFRFPTKKLVKKKYRAKSKKG